MATEIQLFDAQGDGTGYFKRVYVSTTGQLIGVDQSDVSVILGNVDSAFASVTKVAPAAVTMINETYKSSGITFPIKASEVLWIEGDILMSSAAAGALDMDYKFVVPASATATGSILIGGAEIYAETDLTAAVVVGNAATGTLTSIHVKALITNSTTAGTVDFQFTHGTSATDVMTLRATSVLKAATNQA